MAFIIAMGYRSVSFSASALTTRLRTLERVHIEGGMVITRPGSLFDVGSLSIVKTFEHFLIILDGSVPLAEDGLPGDA